MRISDWSSDVCSSDLGRIPPEDHHATGRVQSSADGGVGQSDRSWPGRKQGTGRKHHLVVRCPRECQVFHVCACLSPAVYPGGRSVVSGKLATRSEEHTSELQSLMRISYAVFCLKNKNLTLYIILITPLD